MKSLLQYRQCQGFIILSSTHHYRSKLTSPFPARVPPCLSGSPQRQIVLWHL